MTMVQTLFPSQVAVQADPGDLVDTLASGFLGRFIIGTASITPDIAVNQTFRAQRETGVGTAVYETVQQVAILAAAGNAGGAREVAFEMFCRSGANYRYHAFSGTPTLAAWGHTEV